VNSIDESQVTDDSAYRPVAPAQPEIGDLLGIARRGWLFIVAGTALGFIGALIITSTIPPTYKATARIAFERTLPRYMQTNKVTNEPIIDDYDTLGQTYVIASESILLQVVRSLSLDSDPDFAGSGNDKKTLGTRVRGLFDNIAEASGLRKRPADDQSIPHHSDPEKIAFDTVTRNLTVSREDVQSVLTIGFSWKDPVKAAAIVNTTIDTYLEQNIAEKMNLVVVARRVEQARLEELQQQVKDADRAVLEYKTANNLVGSDQQTLTHGQIFVMQKQLTDAQLAMVDAKSRMDASALLAPDNELITKLRAELLDLSARADAVEKVAGKDHSAAIRARNRMAEVQQAIANEQRRIGESYGKEYDLARARYAELSASISQAVDSENAAGNRTGRLRQLQSAADNLRDLYNRMVQQATAMNRVDAQPAIIPDARILMRATPPLQTESSKKRFLIHAIGSMAGLLLGAALVFVRNFPFGVFRTSQQVTNATGLPCAVLPEISGADEQASLWSGEYVLDRPYSRFAQSLRSIWGVINIAQRDSGAKVVGVVSSNPGEGKTTLAINLAAHFGCRSDTRVLLIDADFYRQSLTKSATPAARAGLREALEEPAALTKFVVRKERLNIDVLPCPVPEQMPGSTELLGTVAMEELVSVARQSYDLVIIEIPPMAAIVDYKIIGRHCDGLILVVEWGKTSQRLVLECLSDASALMHRVRCVVLNKADPAALRSIEYYKGARFQAYYYDEKRA
jgi:succinoglycan biosynthesis transport protein ExoP